jgi:glycosyltransferase involved in cell wall biosynthesis
MNPLISVIIPNYNHASFLEERLQSVFGQTYTNIEVILLDDCSTDGSASLIKELNDHPKVSHVLINAENSGSPFKQWKKGIDLAIGDFIWIAESDDYCAPNFLEILVSSLDDKIAIAYTQSNDVDVDGNIISCRTSWTSNFSPNIWESNFVMDGDQFLKRYLLVKNVIPNASAVIFKKSLITEHTFSDTLLDMRLCGDWLFWMKLSLKSDVAFSGENLNSFRSHAKTTRKHNTLATKKLRLLEEGELRSVISNEFAINHNVQEIALAKKWAALFSRKAVFSEEYYSIKIPTMGRLRMMIQLLNKE